VLVSVELVLESDAPPLPSPEPLEPGSVVVASVEP
jgi:hypothetical protein